MEHTASAFRNTAASADDNEVPIQDLASRVTDAKDALLAELLRVTVVHTHMLTSLQAANTTLSTPLETPTARLGRTNVDMQAKDTRHVDASSPGGHHHHYHHHCFGDPFVTHPAAPRYESPHWMDMPDIAATLAVVPQSPGGASSASSRSSSSSQWERRPSKPHRSGSPLTFAMTASSRLTK